MRFFFHENLSKFYEMMKMHNANWVLSVHLPCCPVVVFDRYVIGVLTVAVCVKIVLLCYSRYHPACRKSPDVRAMAQGQACNESKLYESRMPAMCSSPFASSLV